MSRNIFTRLLGTLLLLTCFLQPTAGFAVTLGQVDTFEDGTTQNWIVGPLGAPHPAPPVVVSGGPGGANDHYLLLTSISTALAGNRMAVMNQVQWTGNYRNAAIPVISMDVINLGVTDLYLRLYFSDLPNSLLSPNHIAISARPVFLPAGSGWTSVEFPLGPNDLVALKGNVKAAMNAQEIRIFHNPNASWPPPVIDAQLGVDNITAVNRGIPFMEVLLGE